jgi:ABC-type glycerol-3-phosphate transport system permease component
MVPAKFKVFRTVVLPMIVPLIVFFAHQRYFVQGLLAGSDR